MKNQKLWIKFVLLILIKIKLITMEPTWYEASDGKRYLIDPEEKYNWYQAWNECARYDARLVAIEDHEKNHILGKLLKKLNEKNKNLWIGGNVNYDRISYHWAVNEQEFTYTNWFSEEVEKLANQMQCVYIMRHRKNNPWNIANCENKEFGFICEEMMNSDELTKMEKLKENQGLPGSMYNGSIYGLIG
ncbi:lectin subunit alpha-like [Cochliomyia hominivorax]